MPVTPLILAKDCMKFAAIPRRNTLVLLYEKLLILTHDPSRNPNRSASIIARQAYASGGLQKADVRQNYYHI